MTRARRQPDPASPVVPATMSQHRKDQELEAFVCDRLKLPHLFAGHTSRDTRRDRLKVVLLERGLADSHAGKRDGKLVTWRALFQQLYGEPLA